MIGNHRIGYRDEQGTKPKTKVAISAKVPFREHDYVHDKSFGTDTWTLHVGEVLDELLREAEANAKEKPGDVLRIWNLQVVDFSKGLFQWSRHYVTIRFDYELRRNRKTIRDGTITGSGEGSGTELGFMTFIPIVGNINFNKGMELALTRCLQDCLESLAAELKSR
jgi:hypothetical protein